MTTPRMRDEKRIEVIQRVFRDELTVEMIESFIMKLLIQFFIRCVFYR